MNINPEFRRNLWLEITPYRLLGMPLVLAAVFYLSYVSDDYQLGDKVRSTASGLFFLLSLIWGTKLASESIMNEIRDHTWDGQRMSELTPWQLTWGKLFGSTVFTWYGAGICLLFQLLASNRGMEATFKTLMVLVLAGILSHAVSLQASLMAIQKERKFNKSQTAGILMFGIFVAGPFFSMAYGKEGATVSWYGLEVYYLDLLLATLLAYTCWAVTGLHHLIRLELQMKNHPWVWSAFVIFCMGHIGGFFQQTTHGRPGISSQVLDSVSPPFLAAFFVATSLVYLLALAERKDPVALRTLAGLAAAEQWPRFFERAPRWIVTLLIAVLAGVAVMATAAAGSPVSRLHIVLFILSCIFLTIRDLGLMLFFNLAASPRRADMLLLLSLALLYGVFPAILAAMKAEQATALFWPRPDLAPVTGCLLLLGECLLVGVCAYNRWKQRISY